MEYLDTVLFGQASWMHLCLLSMGEMFTRMATGAGKSLVIFSVPLAHSNEAVGVIISPLISLMENVTHRPCIVV